MKTALATLTAELAALAALCNSGTIKIYTGAQPSTPETGATGTLLATLTFNSTAFGGASNGVITANAITSDSNAAATGTAGWFRAAASGGAAVFDGTVGTSAADLILNSVAIQIHAQVSVSAMTVTLPA